MLLSSDSWAVFDAYATASAKAHTKAGQLNLPLGEGHAVTV